MLVKDADLRREIRAAAWDQAQVTESSLLVVMCADLAAHTRNPARYWSHAPQPVQDFLVPALIPFYEGKSEFIRDEAMRSIGLAGMTLMLAARGMNYDSCPMIGYDPEAVGRLIHRPQDHVVGMMIAIGKKVGDIWPRGERLPNSEVVITNRFA